MRKAFAVLFTTLLWSVPAFGAEVPLDRALRPEATDEVPNVFLDMGVVQRRAMAKSGRFLLSSFGSFDFSDGPYTNYSLNVNPGFALSDFWEIYVNYAPAYFVSARSIVQAMQARNLEITAARPKYQIGGELLWAPAYGKDSLGIRKIIRSDTFFKASVSRVTYDSGTGMRYALGLGKTYFLGRHFGFRICVNMGRVESIVDNVKAFRTMALLESGLMVYL